VGFAAHTRAHPGCGFGGDPLRAPDARQHYRHLVHAAQYRAHAIRRRPLIRAA
jgi:hypothetical protein